MNLNDFLVQASNEEVGNALTVAYDDIVTHYTLGRWKYAGLDAGHFVEAARRFLELKLFGAATPISKGLSNFGDKALSSYLNGNGDESYRILIPRTLWSIYALRNKRSIGHLGAVPASEIDATLLLSGAKWVLSEIVRIESSLTAEDTRELVNSLIARQQPTIWRDGQVLRVLDSSHETREKVLILLAFNGDMSETALRDASQYKNLNNFRKILRRLDEKNLISYTPDLCKISPSGLCLAEETVNTRKSSK
ncbi:hypothetical protein HKD42_06580 [Altererythrobacter sp. RZ02]|uniref:Uncharacterized protein n=1 Tax=Pontixanthobacter rizhaonensis TaxID=2730337 RepID=A0A848QDL8_9SPHN|nr:hypothetical protein [Pontixanthobacter rizhaonensis]NMW31721.1 hypothetical protein [Pontixanthobacter rizhaonensis]